MATNSVGVKTKKITTAELISKFQYALDNKWGYIWGTAGVLWTEAKQKQLNQTTDSDRENGRKYGAKWIGHYVADCSGLFSWAFKQYGAYMYHGSNTMWLKYCTSKGELVKGKRDDNQELKPGTAVFTYNAKKNNRGHVGLYIGDGKVIEASGTQAGVCTSKVTDKKWVEWGELQGVIYDGSVPADNPDESGDMVHVGSAIVNDTKVALRASPSTSGAVLIRVDKGERVSVLDNEWTKVTYKGKTGYMMTKFLNITS